MHAPRRHPPLAPWILCVGLCALAIGCDEGTSSSEGKQAEGEQAAADGKEAAEGEQAAADGKEAAAEGTPSDADVDAQVKQFMKDQTKKGCEMLPPAMAAKILEVPEDELKQMKIMGCIYSWKGEGKKAEASITSIWVKKTPEAAQQWFTNSTANKTAEEMAAEMAKVKEMMKKSDDLDTKTKQKGAGMVGDALTEMTAGQGVNYEDVEGVGDAARINTYDGSVTVLVGNLIFNVRAYKGEPQPPPDTKLIMTRDIKKITAAAKKSEAEFLAKTIDVRREMGIELAKAVVAGL